MSPFNFQKTLKTSEVGEGFQDVMEEKQNQIEFNPFASSGFPNSQLGTSNRIFCI